jgi:hypothetical protein
MADREVVLDLHGYHPGDIELETLVRQAWEMGAGSIQLIHGHGRGRGLSPGFVNTNTGYFGLTIRAELRHDRSLRQWIKYTTLDCSHPGATTVKLKSNREPTRTKLDDDVLPTRTFRR